MQAHPRSHLSDRGAGVSAHAVLNLKSGSLFQPDAWTGSAGLVCSDEHHACAFQSPLNRCYISRGTPPRTELALHSSNGLERDSGRVCKAGSAPAQEGARRSDLRGRHHGVVFLVPHMVLLD